MLASRNLALAVVGLVMLIVVLVLTPAGQAAAQVMKPLLVQIINDATAPVLVRDVDQPSRQIFRAMLLCIASAGEQFCGDELSVPAGKLLVVETIAVHGEMPAGQQLHIDFFIGSISPLFRYNPPVQRSGGLPGLDYFEALHQVRLYAQPDEHIELFVTRDSSAQAAGVELSLSGHLVDCVPPPQCALP